ncbi:MAG: hypothetical protein IJU45_00700 [Clostridia bacterium]|nr:hypothetical protein [Clostridia bacterium]
MNITFFSVVRSNSPIFSESKKIISDCVNAFAGQSVKIKNFSSPKRMLVAASQALRSTDVVVIAVQSSMYNTVKKMMCTSLDLNVEQKREIYDELYPLYDKGQLSETALVANSHFPESANVFATLDLKCCGFSVVAGAQSIVVLPLDPVKTAETVFGSLYDFFAEFSGISNTQDVVKFKRAAIMTRIVSLLRQSDSKLVFLPLGGEELIDENIEFADTEHKFVSFSQKPEARKVNQPGKEYIIYAVQKARIDSQVKYACVVSNPFVRNKDNTVFVMYAACDEKDTVITKIFADGDETPKEVSAAAVENMLILAGSKIMKNILAEQERSNKPDKVFRRTVAIISAASVALSAAAGTLVALLIK